MNNSTLEKIKLAIIAVDSNPKMAPHMVSAIKKNIESKPAGEVAEWWEAFDMAISEIKSKPEWITALLSLKDGK